MRGSNRHVSLEEIIGIAERQGYGYEASVLDVSIPAGDTLKTIFITGSRPVIFYSRRISYDSEGINAYIYRDPVYTGGTESIDVNNANDIVFHDEGSVFLSSANVTDDGVLTRSPVPVHGNTSNQGKGNVLQSIDTPQLMLPNRTFNFVIENRDSQSAQLIGSLVQWVEPVNIPDLELDESGNFVAYRGPIL